MFCSILSNSDPRPFGWFFFAGGGIPFCFGHQSVAIQFGIGKGVSTPVGSEYSNQSSFAQLRPFGFYQSSMLLSGSNDCSFSLQSGKCSHNCE